MSLWNLVDSPAWLRVPRPVMSRPRPAKLSRIEAAAAELRAAVDEDQPDEVARRRSLEALDAAVYWGRR